MNCSVLYLREVIRDRFLIVRVVFVKYKDEEGDMIIIIVDEELRWVEVSVIY